MGHAKIQVPLSVSADSGSYEHEYSDGCIGFFSHGEPPAVELCVQDFLSELGSLLERQLEVLSGTLLQ